MIEGVAVIKSALTGERFSFEGKHYQISGYQGNPRPVQVSPPWLIGGGAPRVLKFAAEQADIIGINGNLQSGAVDATTYESMTAESVDEKVGWVIDAAGNAGRLADIEMNVRAFIVSVTDDVDGTIAMMASAISAPEDLVHNTPVRVGRPSLKARRRPACPARPVGVQLHHRRPERRGSVRTGRRRARWYLKPMTASPTESQSDEGAENTRIANDTRLPTTPVATSGCSAE